MATPILRGTDEPQLQYQEISFSPNSAGTEKHFKGISYEKMAALANYYGSRRWTGKLRSEFGMASLTVTGANARNSNGTSLVAEITDKWEMAVETERPDLCENQYFQNEFYYANAAYIQSTGEGNLVSAQFFSVLRGVASSADPTMSNLRKECDSKKLINFLGQDFGSITIGETLDAFGNGTTTVWAGIKNFVADYLRGQTNYTRSKYTLRHTTNAPDDYDTNIADSNVGKIYNIAQLLSECESSSLWLFPLPGYLSYKILTLPAPVYAPSNYQWGAIKTGSNAVTAARNRVEIVTEYIIDSWPIHTYGTV